MIKFLAGLFYALSIIFCYIAITAFAYEEPLCAILHILNSAGLMYCAVVFWKNNGDE